ncbi:C2 domain-containing protein At1g53590-like isoform X2 [Juglans microcarpa x Juglans regia]|uniref:C2 domain-containing protein At1g53590-like isoform X2 n=1 Tax=Juglans microcarpa x Juglans regia TaxID=2249226 RepID=UPI001B7E451F|nr:C2 domain-containing protein At1g53590-like isoform X2 [Juglans microcarpa x Juglans regia]
MEMFIMLHVGSVLLFLWLFSWFNWCHPIAYFVSLIYLYLVQEQYITRMRRKLQFEERKQADQRRVLSDSETVRWLNHAVERIWPICMEQIASQKILLPIIPWFLEKYKPWTAKKAVAQHLYLGRNPPMFTEMRVLHQSSDDDHLVMELGMNFLTADDMSAIIAVQLRKSLGFGMWAKLHITGMHVEGKVLIGVKFLHKWPFIGRLRVCFAEPPYFQMTVKPIFTHGLDVTEIPGIAGWLDKLLSLAFEQTLVEPNMLVVDMEKFASPQSESWFSVDEKEPVAYAKVEVIEGSDMKPSDPNGLADPYVKGQLGTYRFRTKIQKKTLAPKWHEEFKIPIFTWESANMLCIEVRDKDYFVDDTLGGCSVNISDLRDGQRHDVWFTLQNIKMGRLHLAITVLEDNKKETLSMEDKRNSFAETTDLKGSFSSVSSLKSPRVPDNFEPIDIDGQTETGIWVHHPGSEISQRWEPRKGKSRRIDTKIHSELNGSMNSFNASASGSLNTDTSSTDENPDDKSPLKSVQRGLRKIGSVFHRTPRKEDQTGSSGVAIQSPHVNLRAVNSKEIGVKFVMEGNSSRNASGKNLEEENATSPKESGSESPRKGNMKGMAKSILRHAGKSARGIKHVISREGSKNSRGDASVGTEREITAVESDHSEDESCSSPGVKRISSIPEATSSGCVFYPSDTEELVVQTYSNEDDALMGIEGPNENKSVEDLEKKDDKPDSHDQRDDGVEESLQPKLAGVDLEGDKIAFCLDCLKGSSELSHGGGIGRI